MNCWFCNNQLVKDYCNQSTCRGKKVIYIFYEIKGKKVLFKVQFTIELKYYQINYFQISGEIMVEDRFTSEIILSSQYTSLILTPSNAKRKLPMLITFS